MKVSTTAWFERGADAFERARPGYPRVYVCPLCLIGFKPEALKETPSPLTREHIPPRAVGGRQTILTCSGCNCPAGHELDDELAAHERQLDFATGTMSRPMRARAGMGGNDLNVAIQHVGDSMIVQVPPRTNDPRAEETYRAELDRLVDAGTREWSLNLALVPRVRYRRALLGWLRAAYLAAFAALGYRYILRPQLALVREQLQKPDDRVIEDFSATMPRAPATERRLLLVEKPTALRSLTVQMGRHLVFLPGLDSDADLYTRLTRERAAKNELFHAKLSGKTIPWPGRPEFALDFHERAN